MGYPLHDPPPPASRRARTCPTGTARHSRPTSGPVAPGRPSEVVPRAARRHGVPAARPRTTVTSDLREESDPDGLPDARPDRRPACRRARTCPRSSGGCSTTGPPTRPSRPSSRPATPGANGANEYVFYDGPPFANGLPHYGHLLTGYVKDVVPRYQTMRGRRVERRFGWDCHGLPAEVEAEKQLGITTKAEILDLGVAKFNEACRTSVLRYTQDWERYVTRQARWVDFANDYKTLDLDYMESVMWAFKTLHDKGLVYEGFRVLAYCWRCETPLSNTETRMDDVYRDRQDPALTVWFELLDEPGEPVEERSRSGPPRRGRCRPTWRSPSARTSSTRCSRRDGERLYVGAARLGALRQGAGGLRRRSARCTGADLVGRRYTPLFDFLVEQAGPNAYQVLGGGLRHHRGRHRGGAPAPRPSARTTRTSATRPASRPWSPSTTTPGSPRWSRRTRAMQVFEANKPVIRELKERGVVLRHDTYTHSYPHCWRCDTPLVYKAVSSLVRRGDRSSRTGWSS